MTVILMVMLMHKEHANDVQRDVWLHKIGDVVDMLDGDHPLSPIEASGYPFLPVYVDGATRADMSGFLAEGPADGSNPAILRQRRAFALDLTAAGWVNGVQSLRLTRAQALAFKVRKAPRLNPSVFG